MTQPVLPDVFACSDCGEALNDLSACAGCGRIFGGDPSCPELFPSRAKAVSWTVSTDLLSPEAIARDKIYSYPPRSGQQETDAYHLDLAHLDVFETLNDGDVVLEIGCGGGQMRNWLKGRGVRYVGTDVSKERVHDWLAEHGGADVLCDAHALPVRDSAVDAVYAAAVWEHLAFPQLAACEAARVLKPGGYFLGSASFLEPWHDESYYHMTPNGTQMTLALAGFEIVHIWPEVRWPGFLAMLEMGNKATRPLRWLGRVMSWYYLLPKKIQHRLKAGHWPDQDALFESRGKMAGAIAWIARKPLAETSDWSPPFSMKLKGQGAHV